MKKKKKEKDEVAKKEEIAQVVIQMVIANQFQRIESSKQNTIIG
nr:hypothetical protein [Mycoplasmopsis bovis]